jgi:raffinose/stachyose/melibiose transport system permease protein
MNKRSRGGKILLHLYLVVAGLFVLAPLFLLVMNAFKPKLGAMTSPFSLPKALTFLSILEAWKKADYGRGFLNSLLVGLATVAVVVVAASLAAYALSKMKVKGANLFMGALLVVISIPLGVYLVPIFFIYINIGLMDSLAGLVIVYCAIYLPFSIFLFRTYFVRIPYELNESALIDGLNHWQIYWKVMMPISRSVTSTVAIIVGLWTWNEFFFANALLQSDKIKTVATRYLAFVGNFDTDWNLISSAGVIALLPVAILFVFLQDKFVQGITEGSLKG